MVKFPGKKGKTVMGNRKGKKEHKKVWRRRREKWNQWRCKTGHRGGKGLEPKGGRKEDKNTTQI